MPNEYTAVVKQSGEWWIDWVQEIPGVNCRERTKEELLETLRITLAEAIDVSREEALRSAGRGFTEERINA
jgi:predicted RNase H-like HicB family nuclease